MKPIYRSIVFACLILVTKMGVAEDEGRPLPKFTVSEDTTFITEPLTKEGFPDYPAYLNTLLSKGVTPRNNANVRFWQALGPHPEDATMPPEFFKWMDMESPPEVGQYFVDLYRFLANERVALKEIRKVCDDQYKAMSQPWETADYPELADWLKANEKPLAAVAEGARRPRYFSPLVVTDEGRIESGMIGILLPAVQSTRALARALAARAMLNLGEGRTKEAWEDLLTCHRLGRHVGNGATLIEGLVGVAIEGIAMHGDLVLLEHAQPTQNKIAGYESDLKELPPITKMAEKINGCERFMFLDSTFLIARGRAKMVAGLIGEGAEGAEFANSLFMRFFDQGMDLDEMLKVGNEWFDRLQAAMSEPNHRQRIEGLQEVNVELKDIAAQSKNPIVLAGLFLNKDRNKETGRMVGSIMLSLMLPASEAVQSAEDRAEQQQRNLRLAMALAAYRADHDRYPVKLDELSPKYVAEVPDDLFTDKPLVYRLTDNGYLLYSLGQNGKDDGGNFYDDQPQGDDLRVRMPAQDSK